MKISIEASTKLDYVGNMQDFKMLAGRTAGVCYMKEDMFNLRNEPQENTLNRAERTKAMKHHSVFDHSFITLTLENIPKLFAMLLNNEKMYVTSEKSARYTQMKLPELEQYLYDKWFEKIKFLIIETYGGTSKFFNPSRVEKLAQENARYFTSVMTPTTMEYTVSLRQLNYMCGWMQKFSENSHPLYKMLKPYAEEFVDYIKSMGYLDSELMDDGKNRGFSLVAKRARQEQFGEVYSVNFEATFASLAQLQRHKTLNDELLLLDDPKFIIPEILQSFPNLVEEWLGDMKLMEGKFPQGQLVLVNERGTYENLILKAGERLCSCTQLESARNTHEIITKIITNTDNEQVKEDLEKISHGARCTFGFKCNSPCGFKEGIDLTRII